VKALRGKKQAEDSNGRSRGPGKYWRSPIRLTVGTCGPCLRCNGTKFTVLSVATQRSWKSTQDEWASKTEWHRVCVFRPQLAERVATAIKKGSHVLVEGELVSSTYERPNGKSKKSATTQDYVLVDSRRHCAQA
jgi:single stranded DNA-binding protein